MTVATEKNGWIKFHRKTLDNPIIMKDADHLAVWSYLLLSATHAEYPALFKGKRIILQPGQLIIGRKSIAEKLSISESKIRRILDAFESDQQIDRQRSNKNTLVSLTNWDMYQISCQQSDQQPTSTFTDFEINLPESCSKSDQQNDQQKVTGNPDKMGIIGDSDLKSDQQNGQQSTNNRPTTDQQPTTNKNIKNNKKDKNETNNAYSDHPSLNEAILEFMKYRKNIKKPMTDRAVVLMLNKLTKMTPDVNEQIDIINQSIMNGWQGIFPLKEKTGQPARREPTPKWMAKNQNPYNFEEIENNLTANAPRSAADDPELAARMQALKERLQVNG